MGRIYVIGDTHFPYHSKAALEKILLDIKKDKLGRGDKIIQVGDLYDFFSLSRFPRSHDFATPVEEITEGRRCAEEMWAKMKKIAKGASCYQIMGNHDVRIKKQVLERLPQILSLVDPKIKSLMTFPDVHTVYDDREELVIDDIAFMHGFYTKLGDHCKQNAMNTVVGHTHRGGCFFTKVNHPKERVIWELNAGFIGDPHSKVMSYTRQKWTNWTLGYGRIDEHGPRFIPIHLK